MSTLNILQQVAHGIAESFGKECEVVIHEFHGKELEEGSIKYIEHGEVTGRVGGDGPSHIVLETIEAISKGGKVPKDRYSYLTQTKDGRILKSSTFFISDDDEKSIYLLGINYDITNIIATKNVLESFVKVGENEKKEAHELIPKNVNELLDDLITQSMKVVGKPVALMSKDDKVEVVRFLNDAGAFLVTHSADRVSNYLGISKYTLYSYINMNK
ncbi:MAG: helix-turn-helix transcriptional regulator [Clostridioides sp.]|jgi:predicted transcriptional regulator YheO|nr:helix-turn-helix transcriptional regulator [Clostridioides sp.]